MSAAITTVARARSLLSSTTLWSVGDDTGVSRFVPELLYSWPRGSNHLCRHGSLGWPALARGGAITAEFGAKRRMQTVGLYEVAPNAAVGVATREPHGATRWRFDA